MITRPRTLLAVMAVPLVAALAACSSSSDDGAPGRSVTPSAALSAPHTSARHEVTRTVTALERWYRTARPRLNHINSAIVRAQRAVNHGDVAALHASCLTLRSTVADFASVATAPDHRVEVSMRRAMSNFGNAADDCVRGDLAPAASLVLRGQRRVTTAARRVDGLT